MRLNNFIGLFTKDYGFVNSGFLIDRYSSIQDYVDIYEYYKDSANAASDFVTAISMLINVFSGNNQNQFVYDLSRLDYSISHLKVCINTYFEKTEFYTGIYVVRTLYSDDYLEYINEQCVSNALLLLDKNKKRFVFYNSRNNAMNKLKMNGFI